MHLDDAEILIVVGVDEAGDQHAILAQDANGARVIAKLAYMRDQLRNELRDNSVFAE